MDGRGPETPGGGPKERGVDAVAWVVVVAVIVALAGGAAWMLSNMQSVFREASFKDDAVDLILVEPVPPPTVRLPADAPPASRPSPTTTVGPNGEVVRNPGWVRQPQPDFPEMAMRRGVESGDVVLLCEILAAGDFGACEVVSESPRGAGFGEAAVAATRQARVTPRSIDGFATDSEIRFTIRFRMAPEP